MNTEDLKQVLNAVYEIEGLAEMALRRPEIAPELSKLIADKCFFVADIAAVWSPDADVSSENTVNTSSGDSDDIIGLEEDKMQEDSEDVFVDDEEFSVESEFSEEIEAPEFTEASEIDVLKETVECPRRSNLRSFISVNDSFRFRRELFNGSVQDFEASVNLVEKMESVDVAYDYFYEDLQWDRDDPVVEDFVDVVNRYFSPENTL